MDCHSDDKYYEESTWQDIVNIFFVVLFGILLLPAILAVIVFYSVNRLFDKDDKKNEDIEYCSHDRIKFKELDLNSKPKRIKRKQNGKYKKLR